MEKRQRFHVVQLSMFNADVLATVQRSSDDNTNGRITEILQNCAAQNVKNFASMPSTVNQSLFFGMAYLTLVWLRESLSIEEVNAALESKHMTGVWNNISGRGPRNINTSQQKMRLIRNALSHGNVSIDDNFMFEFWDQSMRGNNREENSTHIFISNHDLGKLTTSFYYAVSDVLYREA